MRHSLTTEDQMTDTVVRIERARNGFTVEMRDPEIEKKNQTDTGVPSKYVDPYVSFVFETVDDVLTFLKENLEKAMPLDEFSSSFDDAMKEQADE